MHAEHNVMTGYETNYYTMRISYENCLAKGI